MEFQYFACVDDSDHQMRPQTMNKLLSRPFLYSTERKITQKNFFNLQTSRNLLMSRFDCWPLWVIGELLPASGITRAISIIMLVTFTLAAWKWFMCLRFGWSTEESVGVLAFGSLFPTLSSAIQSSRNYGRASGLDVTSRFVLHCFIAWFDGENMKTIPFCNKFAT